MRCMCRYLPCAVPDDHTECRRRRTANPPFRTRHQPRAAAVRFRAASSNRPHHGERRRRLRPLWFVRGALSNRRLGHAEIRSLDSIRRHNNSMQPHLRPGINDFAFKIANVNGTGSASSNGLLMQAIFRMGIPVSGKNLFPSNIQGLPTWYEIRVNKDGYTARALDYDLMVAMNAQTYARDIQEVRSGGYVLYDSSWPLERSLHREDVSFLPVPLARLCNEQFEGARERVLLKNIAYSGVLVALLDADMQIVEELLAETFASKKSLHDANRRALHIGIDYAREHFECPLPFRLEKTDANAGKILIDGNTATALGCLYAGATVAAWYPITPATSVMDAFRGFCEKYRRPRNGREQLLH